MLLTLADAVIAYDHTTTDTDLPPVLFLHGALGVRAQFEPVRQRFPERSQVAIDFPSHGESAVKSGGMNCERLARDTLALLDALDIAQVDIIGHSMGGYVGMVLAHLAPGRVRSIVTLGTKFYWSDKAIDATMNELDAAQLRIRSPRAYDALKSLHTANGVDTTMALTHSLIADFRRWQLTEEMVRAAGVPILVSAGDHDTMVPPPEVARLFESLGAKRSAAAILPNTPHALQKLAADCFELSVRRFWDTTVRDAATPAF